MFLAETRCATLLVQAIHSGSGQEHNRSYSSCTPTKTSPWAKRASWDTSGDFLRTRVHGKKGVRHVLVPPGRSIVALIPLTAVAFLVLFLPHPRLAFTGGGELDKEKTADLMETLTEPSRMRGNDSTALQNPCRPTVIISDTVCSR